MNILIVDAGSYTHSDIVAILSKMGHHCKTAGYSYDHEDWELKYHNDAFEAVLLKELDHSYDCVFTTNFYPLIARVCSKKEIPYLAWSYDSPMNLPLIEEMDHPTNHVFLFDKKDAQRYRDMGFEHFYHLPLAVNCDRLDSFRPDEKYASDVAFIGQLYNSTLPMLRSIMNPYQRELVDKIVQTQLKIYGNWFVDDMLTDTIIEDMNRQFHSVSPDSFSITKEQLAYSIAQQITYMERMSLLKLFAGMGYKVDLFTGSLKDDEKALLEKVNIHGRVSYDREMPVVFKSCRINLNPTLKIIKSGIPLRALDIMGCGGFLLANFQPEIAENFADGKEVVMYRSMEEAAEKVKYYLSHDEERERIARLGYEKVRKDFSYEDRIVTMFRTAGLEA